jgi:hypothetical protein
MDSTAYVESYCSTIVDALKRKEVSRSGWAGIIKEIQGVSRMLPDCNFLHIGREGNQGRDWLAG